MFNYGDKVRINCPYFNDNVNGKIGEIIRDGEYDAIKDDYFYTVKVKEKENNTIFIVLLVYSNYLTKIPKITSCFATL